MLKPWCSNRTKSIVKSPKRYLADTGLLCALLNVRTEQALRDSPSVGAIWGFFVFAQLRHRDRQTGHSRNLFFWRDRAREVDFVVERAGHLELFEAKWTAFCRQWPNPQTSPICANSWDEPAADAIRLSADPCMAIPSRKT